MSDRQSESRRRVTLEDLLRLKRAERPPPEFWTEFEGELRQRQLAALVEKKSWWRETAFLPRIRALRVPLGATAVLALTLLSIHRYAPPVSVEPREIGAPPAGPVAAAAVTLPARTELVAVDQPVTTRVPAALPTVAPRPEEHAAPAAGTPATASRDMPGIIPWLGDVALDRLAAAETSGMGRSVAVGLSNVSVMAETGLANTTAPTLNFEERAMPEMHRRSTADVLPTAAAAAAPRRARLLAVLDTAGASFLPEPSVPEHVRRSATRYLMQDGGDRAMGRLAAEAVGLSLVRF